MVLVVGVMMKEIKFKGVVIFLGVIVLLGIIEFVMFGVNLKLCYLFIVVICGVVLVSVFIILFNVKV